MYEDAAIKAATRLAIEDESAAHIHWSPARAKALPTGRMLVLMRGEIPRMRSIRKRRQHRLMLVILDASTGVPTRIAGASDTDGSVCSREEAGLRFLEIENLGELAGVSGAFGYAAPRVTRIEAFFSDGRAVYDDASDGVFVTLRDDDVAISSLRTIDEAGRPAVDIHFHQSVPPSAALRGPIFFLE